MDGPGIGRPGVAGRTWAGLMWVERACKSVGERHGVDKPGVEKHDVGYSRSNTQVSHELARES
jgi:hypothetical protein